MDATQKLKVKVAGTPVTFTFIPHFFNYLRT